MRKITAFLLSIVLVVSFLPIEALETEKIRDMNALNVVKNLNILDAYADHTPDEMAVSRGEFAAVISRLLNLTWLDDESQSLFADVDRNNPYYHQIMLMGKMQIMIGNEQGLFCPGAAVTFAQTAKCLLYILGYQSQAEQSGGYPSGYLAQASRLGILDGLEDELQENVSRSALAQMIYHSLDIVILDVVSIGKGTGYSDAGEKTILSKYLNVEKIKGILTAVDGRSILNRSQVSGDGYVQIGEKLYEYEDNSIIDFLGYDLECYVTAGDGEPQKVVYAFAHARNRELLIPIKNLDTNASGFSLTNFYYIDYTGRQQEAELVDKLCFVYNGVYDYDFDINDLNFMTGYVKLLDNNNDGVYEFAFIWSYENFVVDSLGEDIISCQYNKVFKKQEDVDYQVLGYDGTRGDWDLLSEASAWDILSVASSKDGSLITVTVNRGGVSGTVEALTTGASSEIEINGQSYTISEQYLSLNQSADYVNIECGLSSEFYFDVMGEIAAVYYTKANDVKYGYLLGIMKKSSIDTQYQVKIFNQDGKEVVLTTKEKIKMTSPNHDGNMITCEEAFDEFYENGDFEQQLIQYSVDGQGLLSTIEKQIDATLVGYNLNRFSKDFDLTESEYRYQDATSTFGDKDTYNKMFHINAQTIVFYLPLDNGKVSEENMNVSDASLFVAGKNYKEMEVYDCDDTYQASIVVYKPQLSSSTGAATTTEEYFFVIQDVVVGLNSEGEIVNKVRGMYRGSEQEFEYISADGSKPEEGSIVKCEKRLSGELIISEANVIYSPTKTQEFYRDKTEALPLVWSQYGRLFRKNGSAITVYDGSDIPIANFLHSDCALYKIRKNKTLAATEDELIPSTGIMYEDGTVAGEYDGTLMVINNRYQYVREMFIIEK